MSADWSQTPGARPRGVALILFVLCVIVAGIGVAISFAAPQEEMFWAGAQPRMGVVVGFVGAVSAVLIQRGMQAVLSERRRASAPHKKTEESEGGDVDHA